MNARDKDCVRERLRQATATLHKEVEDRVQIERALASIGAYRRVLSGLIGLYQPFERALGRIDWRGTTVDMAERRRSGSLALDLLDLGLSAEQVAVLPRLPEPTTLVDVPTGLGALYVLEGSTLGGLMIFRNARFRLGVTAERGGRFFAGYGPERHGAMWRALVADLETLGVGSPAAERALASAIETFQVFGAWLEAPAKG